MWGFHRRITVWLKVVDVKLTELQWPEVTSSHTGNELPLIWSLCDNKLHFWLQSVMSQRVFSSTVIVRIPAVTSMIGVWLREQYTRKFEPGESNTAVLSVLCVCLLCLDVDLCPSVAHLLCIWLMLFKLCGLSRIECKTQDKAGKNSNSNNNNSTPQLTAVVWIQKYAKWDVYLVSVSHIQQPADIYLSYCASGTQKYYTQSFYTGALMQK